MKVTIVGAGNMGRAIGMPVVAGGHEVEIVDRDPAEAQYRNKLGGKVASTSRTPWTPRRGTTSSPSGCST